jgi:hypothetical protein
MLTTQVGFEVHNKQQNTHRAHILVRFYGDIVLLRISDRMGLTGGGCIWNDIIDKDLDAQVGR